MEHKHDLTFYNILKEENSILPFLDSIFGFLFRCTDFYHGQTGSSKLAQDVVIKTFKKYQVLANTDEDQQVHFNLATSDSEIPAACQEIVLETVEDPQLETSLIKSFTKYQTPSSSSEEEACFNLVTSESEIPAACQEVVLETAQDAQLETPLVVEEIVESYKTIDEEFYNGDDRGVYKWAQSLGDIDITIPTPKRICKANQVKVDINDSSLIIKFLSESELDWEDIFEMPFAFNIVPQESYWSLVPSSHLQVNLEKKSKQWWDRLFLCDPPIDPRKIDTSELDDELSNYDRMKIQEAVSMNEHPNDFV